MEAETVRGRNRRLWGRPSLPRSSRRVMLALLAAHDHPPLERARCRMCNPTANPPTMTEIPADPAQAASEAVENWARTAPARPPGPFADLEWLLDAGLEVRIAPDAAGVKLTLFEGAGSVPVIDPVTVWPNAVVGAALAMARTVAEDAGYAPGGIKP